MSQEQKYVQDTQKQTKGEKGSLHFSQTAKGYSKFYKVPLGLLK